MPKRTDIKKVLIIGSGPIIIGQACEFDYSGTQACKALRKEGYEIVLVNSNPATIMTDPGMADHTYIEPLTVPSLEKIIEKERPDALLPNLGGQTALNLAISLDEAGILKKHNVQVIGVDLNAIKRGEDRIIFKETMQKIGQPVVPSDIAYTVEECVAVAEIRTLLLTGRGGKDCIAFRISCCAASCLHDGRNGRRNCVQCRGASSGCHTRTGSQYDSSGAGGRVCDRLGGAGAGSCTRCDWKKDYGLLHRKRRSDGRAYRRQLLCGTDAYGSGITSETSSGLCVCDY